MRTLGTRRAARGASLVELLVALVLFGVVGAATLRALDRQGRFHGGVIAIMEARAQHSAVHEAMAVELRGASTAAGDVGPLSDSSIVFRLPVGTGVACDVATGLIDFAPDSVAAGQAFARFRTSPQAGDTAWVFDEGPTDLLADDDWVPLAVTGVARSTGGCLTSALLDPVLDTSLAAWRFAVTGSAPATLAPGAPVRLTRGARFALYRSGTEYALGFAERNPATGTWWTIQPVSGPYLPYNAGAPAASGFALQGRDSSGAAATLLVAGNPAAIALATRTRTTRTVRMDGVTRGRYPDSLLSLIGMRNSR